MPYHVVVLALFFLRPRRLLLGWLRFFPLDKHFVICMYPLFDLISLLLVVVTTELELFVPFPAADLAVIQGTGHLHWTPTYWPGLSGWRPAGMSPSETSSVDTIS